MKNFTQLLSERSLSRVYSEYQEYDYGVITAQRYASECGSGQAYTSAQNKQRNKSLFNKLRAKGYGISKVRGSYIENYGSSNAKEVGENSFIVIDINKKGTLKKDLLSMGEEFEQDSVIFGYAGKDAVLYGTNHCEDGYPGYGKSVNLGHAIFGKGGEFMSRIKGRPFVFSEETEISYYEPPHFPNEYRGPVMVSKLHWSKLDIEE